jgi:hypothetical protein
MGFVVYKVTLRQVFFFLLQYSLVSIIPPSCFGGLEVACWPVVPKFAGSNPAEVVGFFRVKKILSTPPSEGK